MPELSPPSVVVVGGGITGLSAAHRLLELAQQQGQRIEVTLLEGSQRYGGLFGTERIGDYLIEHGADSFITNKPSAINLCHRLGLGNDLISTDDRYRRSLILYRGQPVATPDGFNLLAPSQWWPMLTSPLLSWAGKARVAAELFVPRGKPDGDESLAEFVRRRFGQELLDKVVQPLVGGIYTSDPEKLSLKATLPRFIEMEQKYGSVIRGLRKQTSTSQQTEGASGARYGLFASLAKGMGQLQDALAERVRNLGALRLASRVVAIDRTPGSDESSQNGWTLHLQNGDRLSANGVIIALPAHAAADLVEPHGADLASELRGIEYASSAIVVTGHSLSEISHPLDAFGLVVPHRERRRILAVSFLSRKFLGRAPEGKIILRTFVGGAMQPAEFDQSDEQIERSVSLELKEILGVHHAPEFVRVARYANSMPQFHVGHLAKVARIEQLASQISRLELAGNAYHGVGIPDSVQSAEAAAQRVWESIFPAPEMGTGVA